MLDLDHLAVILAEMRRNRQQLLGMLADPTVTDPSRIIVGRQVNQAFLHISRACLDLRMALDLADDGATVIVPSQSARGR